MLCSECRRQPALAVRRPIPRLGGKIKRVCRACTLSLDAQSTLEDEVRIAGQVDRAVLVRQAAAARTEPAFRAPVDVGDLAEDEGHPLARREAVA